MENTAKQPGSKLANKHTYFLRLSKLLLPACRYFFYITLTFFFSSARKNDFSAKMYLFCVFNYARDRVSVNI